MPTQHRLCAPYCETFVGVTSVGTSVRRRRVCLRQTVWYVRICDYGG